MRASISPGRRFGRLVALLRDGTNETGNHSAWLWQCDCGNVKRSIWATPQEQARNRRNNIYVMHNGKRVLLLDAAFTSGVAYYTARRRLKKGWPIEWVLG